jgi:hypothetical protein
MSNYDLFHTPAEGKANGHGRHGRREGDLAESLRKWLADIDASEELRREQLRKIAALRGQVYKLARERGVSPTMLRAARKLMRK